MSDPLPHILVLNFTSSSSSRSPHPLFCVVTGTSTCDVRKWTSILMQRFNRGSAGPLSTQTLRTFLKGSALYTQTHKHLSFHEVTTPDLYLQANSLTHTPSRSVLNTQIVMVRAFRQCTGCNDSYSVSAAEGSGHSPGTSQNITLVFLRFFLL